MHVNAQRIGHAVTACRVNFFHFFSLSSLKQARARAPRAHNTPGPPHAIWTWRKNRDQIVGSAVINKQEIPPLQPWRPRNPTIAEGIFFYHQTHNEELQQEKTQEAITRAFVDAGITPFRDGKWKLYVPESFMNKGAPDACHILHQVFKLQEETAISAYLFKCGLDDQDPADWDDTHVLLGEGLIEGLVVPEVDGLTSDEESAKGEKGDEMEEEEEMEEVTQAYTHLRAPSPILADDDEDVEDEEGGEEEIAMVRDGSRANKRRRQ